MVKHNLKSQRRQQKENIGSMFLLRKEWEWDTGNIHNPSLPIGWFVYLDSNEGQIFVIIVCSAAAHVFLSDSRKFAPTYWWD
jgi:hypothetical protein